MKTQSYRVIVAGAGSMGSAACFHLAKRGVSVLGLEQFDIPHRRGSHHGLSRMIRQSYYEHPDYVPLLRRAYELWDELEVASRERFLYLTGGLYLGPPDGSIVPGSLSSARKHDLPHEELDQAELRARFPSFTPPDDFVGFFEEKAGFLIPERAVVAHAAQARGHGAELRANESILDWESTGNGVVVRTAKATYEADHLVVTAGAWSGPLVRDLGIELTVTRQVLAWFEPNGDPAPFTLGRFPCWFLETESPCGHYGFPMLPGDRGLKIALHKPDQPILPDELSATANEPRAEELEALRGVLRDFFRGADGPLHAACTCLYTNSPDHHFIVGAHPAFENVTIAAGFSGHGFKFASVMGEVLADLATDGCTRHPVGFLGPERFS